MTPHPPAGSDKTAMDVEADRNIAWLRRFSYEPCLSEVERDSLLVAANVLEDRAREVVRLHGQGQPADLVARVKTLLSCLERDRTGSGILLPTVAAELAVKESLEGQPAGSPREEMPNAAHDVRVGTIFHDKERTQIWFRGKPLFAFEDTDELEDAAHVKAFGEWLTEFSARAERLQRERDEARTAHGSLVAQVMGMQDGSLVRDLQAALNRAEAALASAYEEAARVCDKEAEEYRKSGEACRAAGNNVGESGDLHGQLACESCAQAIRNLTRRGKA
jgi:hypothetical protein